MKRKLDSVESLSLSSLSSSSSLSSLSSSSSSSELSAQSVQSVESGPSCPSGPSGPSATLDSGDDVIKHFTSEESRTKRARVLEDIRKSIQINGLSDLEIKVVLNRNYTQMLEDSDEKKRKLAHKAFVQLLTSFLGDSTNNQIKEEKEKEKNDQVVVDLQQVERYNSILNNDVACDLILKFVNQHHFEDDYIALDFDRLFTRIRHLVDDAKEEKEKQKKKKKTKPATRAKDQKEEERYYRDLLKDTSKKFFNFMIEKNFSFVKKYFRNKVFNASSTSGGQSPSANVQKFKKYMINLVREYEENKTSKSTQQVVQFCEENDAKGNCILFYRGHITNQFIVCGKLKKNEKERKDKDKVKKKITLYANTKKRGTQNGTQKKVSKEKKDRDRLVADDDEELLLSKSKSKNSSSTDIGIINVDMDRIITDQSIIDEHQNGCCDIYKDIICHLQKNNKNKDKKDKQDKNSAVEKSIESKSKKKK